MFLPLLFWSLGMYLSSFPPAEDCRWKCSFRAVESLWNISLQLLICAHISQLFQKGYSWSQSFFSGLLFPNMCICGLFFLSHILHFFTGGSCSVEWGSAEPPGENRVGVGSLQLIATNAFWNVCFLLHYGFASLGHFSIIKMLMGNSSCPLLVKLVYLEVIHVFPSSGFSNKRFKLSYTVLFSKIFCFFLDFPLLPFAPWFW